jgi:HK97 family phage major capsid protein
MASVSKSLERMDEIRTELKDLQVQYDGEAFDEKGKARWNALGVELEQLQALVDELEQRRATIEALATRERNVESEATTRGAHFQTRKQGRVPDDPTALEEYRGRARDLDDLEEAYRDGARKLIDESYRNQVQYANHEDAQADAEKLVGIDREVAVRFITTSSREYKKEFATYVRTGIAGREMERTASLTTTAGGFAVPVDLDTTLLLTNAGVANPIRGLARIRQTSVNTVEWINSTGITAGFNAEATEASDNAPTVAQPTANIEKAFAFVPMSIEIAEDWANIQGDMANMFADAKNQLESLKFLKGLGHSSHEPQGLIAAGGATAVTSTATTAVFAVGDLFNVELALSPRYRPNASIVGNKATFQKVRQFASNGVNIWVQLQGPLPPELVGYPAYEWSSIDSTPTTSGSTILVIGDFSYFGIADRVGMNVEFIPHLFGGSNRYPTGQRGLYAYWRTSSQVLSPTLGANSAFQSLKVL